MLCFRYSERNDLTGASNLENARRFPKGRAGCGYVVKEQDIFMRNIVRFCDRKTTENILSSLEGTCGFGLRFCMAISHQDIGSYLKRQEFYDISRDLFRLIEAAFVPAPPVQGQGNEDECVCIEL